MKFTEAQKTASAEIMEAMKSGDETKVKEAWEHFHESVVDKVKADFLELEETHDEEVLASRGYRQLTAREKAWYQKAISALKSKDYKQAFTSIIGTDNEEDLMPTTIIEDVYKNLEDEFPLLQAVNFTYVGYITKWILNDHTTQKAVWGAITAEITKEITSSFKVVDVNQNALTAYACIERGMLDLGPVFLDAYIRTCLEQALMAGIEDGIINGTGHNAPIGLIRDIHEGVTINSSTGYPAKSKTAVTDFTPSAYGSLLSALTETESGFKRKFTEVTLICNQTDYLTKIMPATTVMNANGQYVNNLFPFPTKVIISNAVADNEAIMALLPEYNFFVGGNRNNVIEPSDEYKFLENMRYLKINQYGNGRAFDNTSALYLDITNVDPAYLNVKTVNEAVVEA